MNAVSDTVTFEYSEDAETYQYWNATLAIGDTSDYLLNEINDIEKHYQPGFDIS